MYNVSIHAHVPVRAHVYACLAYQPAAIHVYGSMELLMTAPTTDMVTNSCGQIELSYYTAYTKDLWYSSWHSLAATCINADMNGLKELWSSSTVQLHISILG